MSGLPNELDFALRVATILANSHQLDWTSDSKFIDLLLECCAYYCCVCDQKIRYDFESRGPNNNQDTEIVSQEHSKSETNHICVCYEKFWRQNCNDTNILELVFGEGSLGRVEFDGHELQLIQCRIRKVAELIRYLSFSYEDQQSEDALSEITNSYPVVGATKPMLKFLTLMLKCDDMLFNNIGLDIFSNIALSTSILYDDEQCLQLQQNIHQHCVASIINSSNVYALSRSLEIVSKLLQSGNEEITSAVATELVEQEFNLRTTHLLSGQHDIGLLLSTLEFCHTISERMPELLTRTEDKFFIRKFHFFNIFYI